MMKSLINKKLLVRESFFRINHYTIILTLLLLLKCFECLYSNEFRLDKLYLDENENRGFEKNCGQVGDFSGGYLENIFFTSKNKGYTLFVTHKGVSYVIYRYKEVNAANYLSPFSGSLPKENLLEFSRIDVELVGADISKDKIVYEDTLPGYSNYYLPQCPQGVLFVKTYKKVRIREIYNGIDWIWIYKNGKLHHEFEIKPNARISDIKMKVKFADIKITDGNKKIIYSTPLGEIEEGEVVAFSESENILCSFNVLNGIICFNIQGWNRKNKVVIDPPLALLWATYYGGSGWDTGGEIVTDSLGNIFVAGYTESANFPIQAPDTGAYFQGTNAGSTDLFVLKFNNLGIRQWATYYGGNGRDQNCKMGIDKNGNVFLTGYTFSSNFPTFNPGNDVYFQQNCAGHYDAFIVKLNNIGIRKWATYYGGYEHDIGTSIVTDTSGAVFLTGYTASTDFPTLNPGGETYFQATHSGGNWDLFILKFTNAGVRKWATYYGGNGWDQSSAIKTDRFDNIFLTGVTYSTNFPLYNPGGSAYFQNAFAGERDAFIIKFSNAGVLKWSTYYGGTNKDFGTSVVSDNSGNVFVTGATWSTNFPVYNPGGQTYYQTYKYDWDAFVLKFDNNGARLWATYYGGYEADAGNSIITDKQGNVYITGNTWSEEFPVQNPGEGGYFKSALTSLNIPDIFILKFTNTGVRKWATYYGGTGHDDAFCVSVDRIGNIFITGETHSTDFTTYNPGGNVYFQGNSSGNCESYILKFESSIFLSCEKKQGTRPQKYILYQNFPNPFNNETVIRFELPNAEFLKLKIFNSIGKEIKTLLCEELSSGVYDVKFHADGLPSGIYFYQIESSNYKEVRKMILVK